MNIKEAEVIQVIRTVTEKDTHYVVKYLTLDGQTLATVTIPKESK